MKLQRLMTLSTAVGIVALGGLPAYALETNLVQNLSLHFTTFAQGLSTTNKTVVNDNLTTATINTRFVIDVLGTATTNVFSKKATLQAVTPLTNGTNGQPAIVVQDGTNLPVDVTVFFSTTNLSQQVHSATFKNGVLVTETRYRYRGFALRDDPNHPPLGFHLNTSGLWLDTLNDIRYKGLVVGRNSSVSFGAVGKGYAVDTNNEFVVEGTISVGFGKIVVK